MLLNLSNHPSSSWPEVQIQQAKIQFGEVVDMEFPAIDPAGDEQYIINLANEYFSKIKELTNQHPKLTVHLMGELTFSFALASLLYKHNIPCVASTSKRNVVMINQTKIAEFSFVRFRSYQFV
ncbi:MAG: CRISPR-associated protein [Bacteroidales bacterium]|nr:CRISPR-associated protein [Bacteroidales bacterium]